MSKNEEVTNNISLYFTRQILNNNNVSHISSPLFDNKQGNSWLCIVFKKYHRETND